MKKYSFSGDDLNGFGLFIKDDFNHIMESISKILGFEHFLKSISRIVNPILMAPRFEFDKD